MKKEQLAFLAGGLALGFVLGFGSYHAWSSRPGHEDGAREVATSPMGPSAMGGTPPMAAPPAASPTGGAPMVQVVNDLKKRLQADPKDLDAATQLAHLHHDAGMWAQAVPFYERALELRPGDPDLLTDLGICKQELGDFDAALELFTRASKGSASHWPSLYNTVVVGLKTGKLDVAKEALSRLEQVNPQAPHLASLRSAVAERTR